MSLKDQIRAHIELSEATLARLEGSGESKLPWAQDLLKKQIATIETLMSLRDGNSAKRHKRDAERLRKMIIPTSAEKH